MKCRMGAQHAVQTGAGQVLHGLIAAAAGGSAPEDAPDGQQAPSRLLPGPWASEELRLAAAAALERMHLVAAIGIDIVSARPRNAVQPFEQHLYEPR
jgi:hypothetical protein